MSLLKLTTRSPEETFEVGRRLGEGLDSAAVLALVGELGSGKTLLTKGLASGLGVAAYERVCSPTFVIMQEYVGRLRIHHYDTYRLAGAGELLELGFDEDVARDDTVVVVEWADRVREVLPDAALAVELEHVTLEDGALGRRLTFSGDGARWTRLLERVGSSRAG